MDCNKEIDDFQTSMKNFNITEASEWFFNTDFIKLNAADIIQLLGEGITEDNFKNHPDYFNFCEKQLLKMVRIIDCEEFIFDFLELIDMNNCKLSSSVLVAVTILENIEYPRKIWLEYLLISTFNRLNTMDGTTLKTILLSIIQLLTRLNKHFENEQSILYYFARVTFLVLRTNIDPIEYLQILSSIINDPFQLLEYEFDEMEDTLYLASFFYLYFKTEMKWGPKIYNQFYILEKCSYLALSVFKNNEFGKSFTKLILSKYKDNEIPLHLLNKCHEHFFMEVIESSLYNEHLDVRKESIESLMIYMNKLCSDGQFIVFKYAFSKSIESCIKAELIVKMKQIIFSKIKLKQDLGYFQGVRLLELIRLCCDIPNGPKCLVVEEKEYVLAAITLMYALYSYKGKELNLGQLFINDVKQFVEVIQKAIDNTNEYYKLECIKLDNKENEKENILNLPKLSDNEKRDILSQFNTTTKLVQMNFNMLKDIIKTEDLK